MGRKRKSGPRYANGNRKAPQKAYNKTKKGLKLRVNANKLRRDLKLKVGDTRDAAHYKGSTTKGRPMKRSTNRSRRDSLKIRRKR
jgi:hypothetical protein